MAPEGNSPVESSGEVHADPRAGTAATKPTTLGIGTWKWYARTGKISWSPEYYQIQGVEPQSFESDIDKITALTIEEDRWVHQIDATQAAPVSYSIYFRI